MAGRDGPAGAGGEGALDEGVGVCGGSGADDQEAFVVAGRGGRAVAYGQLETPAGDEHHAGGGVDGELQRFGNPVFGGLSDRLQGEGLAVEVVGGAPVRDAKADHDRVVAHGVLLASGVSSAAGSAAPI